MIVEIGLCAAAGFLFLRGIYHSGMLTGWIAQGLRGETPVPVSTLTPATRPAWDQDKWERELFADVPTAWWLDPNRWGHVKPVPQIEPPTLPCPRPLCRSDQIDITVQHRDMAVLMQCRQCGCEYTRNGETANSRKRAKRNRLIPDKLPCGCAGDGQIFHHGKGETHYVRCGTCFKAWEPASNSPSGRVMGQGETVISKNDAGRLPRPRCRSCGRSHPELHTPIDYSDSFYKCKGCGQEWYTKRDVDVACRHAH